MYKYRLYPTTEQKAALEHTLHLCAQVYNAALQERRDAWNVVKKHPNYYNAEWRKQAVKDRSISYYNQAGQLPEIKKAQPEYKEVFSQVLQEVLKRVDKAFAAFFRRVKAGQKAGYPRFRSASRFDSFTYPQQGFSLTHDHRLCLSKIGTIKVKLHRELEGTIKTVTIKREGAHWYACFACEGEKQARSPYIDEAVGIDVGLLHFATLSTGDTIENPRYYRKAEKKVEKAQQALSRKKRGSKRHRSAVQRVSQHHRKVRNQRQDFLHQWSRRLVDTYETLVFEDIQPAHLSKRPKSKQDEEGNYLPNGASAKAGLNKSINDAGWSQFIAMCEYKAACAGTVQVVRVDPKYTSQVCSGCGAVRKKRLDERWHSCECGCELDRDHNAALNIKERWLGRSHQERS